MKKNNKSKLEKRNKIILVSFIVFFLLSGLLLSISGLLPQKEVEPDCIYNTKRDLNYKVYLNENSFYEEDYIGMDKQYATELINYIDTDFKYSINASNIIDVDYEYEIIGTIVGNYGDKNNNGELWTKKISLLPKVSKKLIGINEMNLKENIKINYKKYSDIVDDFKRNFKLAIDAVFKIDFKINYKMTLKETGEVVEKSDVIQLDVPLSKSTISISRNFEENNTDYIIKDYSNNKNAQMITGIIMLLIGITSLVIFKNQIFEIEKSEYTLELEKILKEYSEIIAETSTLMNLKHLEILDIKTFEDMVDIEEELKSPIMYYEKIKNKESWFIVVNDKYAYKYILLNKKTRKRNTK